MKALTIPPTRRQFLRTAQGAIGLAAAQSLPRASAQAHNSRIEIVVGEPIGTIAPEIYGHFVEHAGAVVYDGIWVGEKSKIPNIQGLRRDVIDAFKKVKPSVVRWPGGCFADSYDWRDGTGAHSARPRRTNFWFEVNEWPKQARKTGPERFDPNHFGTVEFVRFCKLVGAQPYLAANLRSLTAQDFWHWIEYCNSPAGSTTLAEKREADGEREPLNVRFWGVGNESWGCGGNFAPEDYAIEFKRFTAWVPDYGVKLALIGSGPNDDNREWTRKFFEKARGSLGRMWGWGAHHYSWNASGGRTRAWNEGKRDAVNFDEEQYYDILKQADETEGLITSQWGVMAEQDPTHRVKLAIDEWGSWYAPGTEPFPEALLGQQNTMRDAVLAGLSLDIFNRHADKVAMANIAQLVNFLQSLFFAHEDKFALTPTYHVFDMYSAHQGGTALRTMVSAPSVAYTRNSQAASTRGLNGSASLKGKQLTLTVTNPSMKDASAGEISLRGASIASATAIVLAAQDARAHNTFENPRAVEPRTANVTAKGSSFMHTFPPASVTKFAITLA